MVPLAAALRSILADRQEHDLSWAALSHLDSLTNISISAFLLCFTCVLDPGQCGGILLFQPQVRAAMLWNFISQMGLEFNSVKNQSSK